MDGLDDAHVKGFTALLDRDGIAHRIVVRFIGVTDKEHADWARIAITLLPARFDAVSFDITTHSIWRA
jgi:hypothetical protein